MSEIILNKFVVNRLTKTQFDNASDLSNQELYLVDNQFTGNKLLKTNANGEIVEAAIGVNDIPAVIDNTTSTSISDALSANMGREMQAEIDNLKARGRFLALWNCATGLPATNPVESPYVYKAGDYYIVGTVAGSGGTNYEPTGSSYVTGTASTVVETSEVAVDDVYYYDGTQWKLQANTQKTVSFANIAGQPTDNTNLATALNAKVSDVQVNGTTVVSDGVANIPKASNDGTVVGVVQLSNIQGSQTVNGYLAAVDRSYNGFAGAASTSIASIGGVKAYVGGMSVAYNASQSLTDAQKEQARTNISASEQTSFVDWID